MCAINLAGVSPEAGVCAWHRCDRGGQILGEGVCKLERRVHWVTVVEGATEAVQGVCSAAIATCAPTSTTTGAGAGAGAERLIGPHKAIVVT